MITNTNEDSKTRMASLHERLIALSIAILWSTDL